jgi:hypothetical protein
MRLRFAPLAVVAAAFAIAPAGASAAPDREASLAGEGATTTWTSEVGTGTIYGSPIDDRAPACSPVFSCDQTLIQTDSYGNLEVAIVGKGVNDQDTLKDIDLHVFISNADGTKGELLQESTSAAPSESVVIEDLPAGYYLVYVDWYLGAGTFDGTATLAAPTTPDPAEPPVFVPAESAYEPVTPARSHTFATAADPEFSWTSTPGAGVSDAAEATGCVAVNCDYSLFQVGEAGVLNLSTTGDQDTLVDGDIHVYRSNEEGGMGEEVGAATAFTPDETMTLDVEPGYYLMRYQFTGLGSYTGKASLSPVPVEEPEPTE